MEKTTNAMIKIKTRLFFITPSIFPLVYVNKLPRYFVLSRELHFKTNILVAPLIAIPFLDAPLTLTLSRKGRGERRKG